jgi:hypothetical protein
MDAIHETVHRILTDTSLQQFDDKLHGLNERRPLDKDGNPIQSDSRETKESEKEEVDENGDQFKKCPVCNLDACLPWSHGLFDRLFPANILYTDYFGS